MNTNDGRNDMQDIRLTTRGKIVFGTFLAALSIATYWMLLDIVTPAECKVPAAQMSEGCASLVYEK
jgi:hypothetical protein